MIFINGLTRLLALSALILILSVGIIQSSQEGAGVAPAAAVDKEMGDASTESKSDMQKRTMKKKGLTAKNKLLSDKNKKEGANFLAENAGKEGVVTLTSGLQYKIVNEGNGRKPALTDTVKVNYSGTLINGKEFDSTYRKGGPARFRVDKVIKGWTEALQLMKEGSAWVLYVPSDLAYGSSGTRGMIGPNKTLIFEVELISIDDAARAAVTEASTKAGAGVKQEGRGSKAAGEQGAREGASLVEIRVSFKLDPRLTSGIYMGERWVSPPTYTLVQEGNTITVEARAEGFDTKGMPMSIRPKWIPSDSGLIEISPDQGPQVKITVRHAGQSSMKVTVSGFSKEFFIKAAPYMGNSMEVKISQ